VQKSDERLEMPEKLERRNSGASDKISPYGDIFLCSDTVFGRGRETVVSRGGEQRSVENRGFLKRSCGCKIDARIKTINLFSKTPGWVFLFCIKKEVPISGPRG
jgi:hypothetical protein